MKREIAYQIVTRLSSYSRNKSRALYTKGLTHVSFQRMRSEFLIDDNTISFTLDVVGLFAL